MTADTTAMPLTVRVIDYCLPGVENAEPVYRLITTLLDPVQAPAHELARLYHARRLSVHSNNRLGRVCKVALTRLSEKAGSRSGAGPR
jgi:hypothetical protein